jgi:hypothetical protein
MAPPILLTVRSMVRNLRDRDHRRITSITPGRSNGAADPAGWVSMGSQSEKSNPSTNYEASKLLVLNLCNAIVPYA